MQCGGLWISDIHSINCFVSERRHVKRENIKKTRTIPYIRIIAVIMVVMMMSRNLYIYLSFCCVIHWRCCMYIRTDQTAVIISYLLLLLLSCNSRFNPYLSFGLKLHHHRHLQLCNVVTWQHNSRWSSST